MWLAASVGGMVSSQLPPSGAYLPSHSLIVFLLNNREGVVHLDGQSLSRPVLLASVVTVL